MTDFVFLRYGHGGGVSHSPAWRQRLPACLQTAQPARTFKLPKGERYQQAAFAAYAVNRLSGKQTFGRVQQMKYLYLLPHILAQESHIHAERKAAGPWDPAILL